MARLTSYVFDSYDDIDGRVLRSIISSPEEIPSFVKTASRLSAEQISKVPDDRFALVMFDEGQKLKKYAMVDKGNTALSVLYLLKQAHLLPPLAVKTAATNLVSACRYYGLDAPEQLKVAAATGTSGISGKSQRLYVRGAKVNKINFPVASPPGESTVNPDLGRPPQDRDLEERTNIQGVQGTNFVSIPIFSQKEKQKEAGLEKRAFSHQRIVGSLARDRREVQQYFSGNVTTKQQAWGDKPVSDKVVPYVDVSGWDPAAAQVEDHVPPQRTLLGDKYPVDDLGQVKTASAYFVEHWRSFHPRDRHEYCTKLASRMHELGMPVASDVERYGSQTYAADADSYLESRKPLIQAELVPALEMLIEKRASIRDPDVFVSALEEFDKIAGLNWFWGSSVPDPWWSTFGPSLEKLAAEDYWCYDEQGARIRLEDLESLARNGKRLLRKVFRDDLVEDFLRNPKKTFEAMPRVEKLVLARMAMDGKSGSVV